MAADCQQPGPGKARNPPRDYPPEGAIPEAPFTGG